jgi:hypothetical protein
MPALILGKQAYHRSATRQPEIRLVNRYLEQDPTNAVDGVAILPRPGLVPWIVSGSGPNRGMFRQSGVLSGDFLALSGETLKRITTAGASTNIGSIPGSGLVEFTADGVNTFIAAGSFYYTDGAAVATITTPDDVQIVSVATINGYVICQVAESGVFYWLPPVDTTLDALDFATAERWPDKGIAVRTTIDEVWFFNEQTTEVWVPTGNADAPFQRIEGRMFEVGCSSRATVVNLDNTIFWVGEVSSEGVFVYRGGAVPEIVSTNGISERLNGATDLSAFGYSHDGHSFYALRIGGVGTFVYDISTKTWSEFASYGRDQWRPITAAAAPGAPLTLGDDETGQLWTLDPEVGNDDGQPIIRTVTGGVPTLQRGTIDNISIQAAVGWSPNHDLEPVISLRFARDLFTFKDRGTRSLGKRGEFNKRIRWEGMGEILPPGMIIELTDSDDAQTRLSYCRYNEAG